MIRTVHALWNREIIKFVRDRSRVIGALLQPLGFWMLLGFGFSGTFRMPGGEDAGVPYLEYLFPGIVALILLFTAIFSTISVVEDRQEGFLQAALVAPAPRVSRIPSRASRDWPIARWIGSRFASTPTATGNSCCSTRGPSANRVPSRRRDSQRCARKR